MRTGRPPPEGRDPAAPWRHRLWFVREQRGVPSGVRVQVNGSLATWDLAKGPRPGRPFQDGRHAVVERGTRGRWPSRGQWSDGGFEIGRNTAKGDVAVDQGRGRWSGPRANPSRTVGLGSGSPDEGPQSARQARPRRRGRPPRGGRATGEEDLSRPWKLFEISGSHQFPVFPQRAFASTIPPSASAAGTRQAVCPGRPGCRRGRLSAQPPVRAVPTSRGRRPATWIPHRHVWSREHKRAAPSGWESSASPWARCRMIRASGQTRPHDRPADRRGRRARIGRFGEW
jgi:hypothetical protein